MARIIKKNFGNYAHVDDVQINIEWIGLKPSYYLQANNRGNIAQTAQTNDGIDELQKWAYSDDSDHEIKHELQLYCANNQKVLLQWLYDASFLFIIPENQLPHAMPMYFSKNISFMESALLLQQQLQFAAEQERLAQAESIAQAPFIEKKPYITTTYVCPYCEMEFKKERARNDHLMEKHKDNPKYSCDDCDEIFIGRSPFAYHRKHIHRKRKTVMEFTEERLIKYY